MFTDIHNHCAWDIDDGMENKENAIQALETAKADDITKIIATPHFIPGSQSSDDIQEINARINELKALASEKGIEVYKGAELFLNSHYIDMVEDGLCNTLNDSRYLLVEFDVRKDIAENSDAEDMLYELEIRDYIPVIAHAERYFHSGIDIERIKHWIDSGYIIQVNRTSLLGTHGSQVEKNANVLLKEGLAHVVASDTHRANGHRVCKMRDVYEYIKKNYGEYNARLLCEINPLHILHDEEVEVMKIEKQSFFKKLLKR